MDHQQWSLRVGASVILCAVLLRLISAGFFQPIADFLARPETLSFLLYLETGRIVRFSPSETEVAVFVPDAESPPPMTEHLAAVEPAKPHFSAEDAAGIKLRDKGEVCPDLEELIVRPLTWDLTGEGPKVLILHTHATESYTREAGETYEESAAFRTLNESYNVISVGDRVEQLLEEGGVSVVHDRSLHDYPSYNGSYSHARKAMARYLEENPTIQLVLDIHRDASGDLNNQMKTEAVVDGKPSAQIMLVVGSNAGGLKHPRWQENLALGLKLHVQLERTAPGICRNLNLRTQRFNQDLCPGALLVEVGAAGNYHREAIKAAEVLARGILALKNGAVTEDSTS